MNANGVGTTLNGGESLFVITKSERLNGIKTATEFALVVRELQPTGNLITATFTRLPDTGTFSVASLRGTYAVTAIGQSGHLPEAGIGTFTFDGAGGFASNFKQNIPGGDSFLDRNIFEGTLTGAYTLNDVGIGTTAAAGGQGVFVVTNATVNNNLNVAEEFFLILKDLTPFSRSVLTSVGRRLSR